MGLVVVELVVVVVLLVQGGAEQLLHAACRMPEEKGQPKPVGSAQAPEQI